MLKSILSCPRVKNLPQWSHVPLSHLLPSPKFERYSYLSFPLDKKRSHLSFPTSLFPTSSPFLFSPLWMYYIMTVTKKKMYYIMLWSKDCIQNLNDMYKSSTKKNDMYKYLILHCVIYTFHITCILDVATWI